MSDSTVTLLNNPYGKSSYEDIRSRKRAFVDKSLMIKYLDSDSMSDYPVLLRPRRFGKSTFVQMLKCYYDLSYADRYEELFSGTRIYEENLPTHNTYHVIDFDFSSVPATNQNILFSNFSLAVLDGIRDFQLRYPDFSFDSSDLDKSDPTALFSAFCLSYADYSKRKNLYLLIDEYDNFANELLSKNLDLFLTITSNDGFLKAFYSAIKKQTNRSVAKTFITGVSSVSLDSLTSGFNIALNVTSFDCFNEYAGFTEDELEILIPKLVDIKKLGVSTKDIISRMKPVYDGYCFSGEAKKTVFNSSMCLYYLTVVRQAGTFLNPEDYLDPACDQDGNKLERLFRLSRRETVDFIIDTYLQGGLFYIRNLAENINLNQIREYTREQLLSMLCYLGYLTVCSEKSSPGELVLKIPNRFMSDLFGKCTITYRFKENADFNCSELNLSALTAVEDDISSFAQSCTEFLSRTMTCQVLLHMNEMALNLALYAKLESMDIVNTTVRLQQSVQVPQKGQNYADLVITVNRGTDRECIYLFELKYLTKTEAADKRNESSVQRLITDAREQVLNYKTALDFKGRNVKAYAMVFAGPQCIYCQRQ